ncbi:hypothetical protein [Rhizobium sp. SYY.PMSO]|uniref:hypothetical protein n=1 Tax=Rhizobium sp. SYY.PMSO TaxID=3382192 RepID=UPI00398F9641
MSVPNEPIPDSPPMPDPGWTPKPPIEEPEPDRLPDEVPVPNPDENEEPPKHAVKQFQEKRAAAFRPDARTNKEMERFGDSMKCEAAPAAMLPHPPSWWSTLVP